MFLLPRRPPLDVHCQLDDASTPLCDRNCAPCIAVPLFESLGQYLANDSRPMSERKFPIQRCKACVDMLGGLHDPH